MIQAESRYERLSEKVSHNRSEIISMSKVIPYHYDRTQVTAGILHVGVGNFHRAHQAFLTNKLLHDADQRAWGICGIMLLPSDERLFRTLTSQENIYTLTVCGRDGRDEAHRIGSIVELIWGIENPQAVFHKIASSATKIITLTITEGGYNLNKQTGEFNIDNEDVVFDLHTAHSQNPFRFYCRGASES
jgi:mannitol 2-dehydrogenase